MAYRTRPIVRLEVMDRMVTKGYQKGVYRRVTKGITRAAGAGVALLNQALEASAGVGDLWRLGLRAGEVR